MGLREEFWELLDKDAQFRDEVRRKILTDELLTLPQLVRELAARLQALAEAQSRTQEHLEVLVESQRQTQELVGNLAQWQRGEAGRRDGERYERNVVKDAPYLFAGGRGGSTDSPVVQERLAQWITPILTEDRFLEADQRPTLADLIWWKGDQVMVVEVSLKVNGTDVQRAIKRAKTLQSAGVQVLPAVIGEDWASLEARELAKENGVSWMVGGIPSESFITFRRLASRGSDGSA